MLSEQDSVIQERDREREFLRSRHDQMEAQMNEYSDTTDSLLHQLKVRDHFSHDSLHGHLKHSEF